MKVWFAVWMVGFAIFGWSGTSGEFRGTVVKGPESSEHWLYVEGHNHSVRRVFVGAAKIHYDSEVPPSERKSPVPRTLPAGTQVRVTAEQDNAGEWRATDIEILKASFGEPEKKPDVPVTSRSNATSKS